MSAPEQVVVRAGRLGSSLVLAAAAATLVLVVAALGISLGSDGWSVWSGWGWTALTWVVLLPVGLGLLVALVVLGREVRYPATTVVSNDGYRRERGGRVERDLPLAELTAVRFRPGGPRGQRLEVDASEDTVTLTEDHRWREVVGVVRRWARERPELLTDEPTRALLATDSPSATGRPSSPSPRSPIGMVALAVRTRDPWAPFLPDDHGGHSRMLGRRLAALRAPERGATSALVARWVVVGLWSLPLVVVVYVLVRLALLAA